MERRQIILLVSSAAVLIGVFGFVLYFRWRSFPRNLVRIAKSELEKWQAISELSAQASDLLIRYWKSVGMSFTPQQMQSPSVQSSYPWSSAFISYLFFKAGAKDRFPYDAAHSGYFQAAKANRDNPGAPLRGFRISEYAPKVGDLVVYSREAGKGYDSTGYFPAHGEVVTETGNGFIKAIGGNVSNKVKESRYTTDPRGFLTRKEQDFFMVIQNNIR